jgi:2-polyprenyl-6-hydroxyphenyl methylase/3-demethylubiquinone-9 3-methyltransferase
VALDYFPRFTFPKIPTKIQFKRLARFGARVTGVDMSAQAIEQAQLHQQQDYSIQQNLKYVNSSIENLLEANRGSLDLITSMEVIEHISDKRAFLGTIHG